MIKRGLFIFIIMLVSFSVANALDYRNLTEIMTVTHWPFYNVYDGPHNSYGTQAGMPKGWPNDNATDSDIIKNFSVSGHAGPLYGNNDQSNLLDWASKTGQGIDIADSRFQNYIQFGTGTPASIDLAISEVLARYGNNPSYRGSTLADEPYSKTYSSILDSAPSRARYIFDKFRELDPNKTHKYYFPMSGAMTIFRHCRDARPDVMLSSGGGNLHYPPAYPLNGTMMQSIFDGRISTFEDEYLCTDNYNIPFGSSNAASNWGGVLNPAEAKANTYLILAHGGKYILWFVYSTAYGIVWENNNPDNISYFTYWTPANWGGRDFPVINNIKYAIDNQTFHSGNNSLRLDVSSTASLGNTFYTYGSGEYPYPKNITYTASVWLKSNCTTCTASINFNGGNTNWEGSVCPLKTGIYDWTKTSCNITFAYEDAKKVFVYMNNPGTSSGSVWYDDFSVYDNLNSYETLSAYNPGFELKYGEDRKPMEPGYSTLRELNLIIKNLSEIAPLKRIVASNNSNVPYKGLIKSIDVSLVNHLDNPSVEYGLFTDKDQGGKVYLILVNRVIVDTANLVVKINSTKSITLVNVVNQQSLGTYNPVNGVVTFNIQLSPGDGNVLRLDNLFYYKELEGNIVYNQDFSSGDLNTNEFQYDAGYYVAGVSGNNVLVGDTTSGTDKTLFIKTVNISDFILTGRFQKNTLTFPNNEMFHIVFRNKATTFVPGNYRMIVIPSTNQALSYGAVQFLRSGTLSWRYLTGYDQNFIVDSNMHNFTIRAYGGKIDLYVDGLKYINAVDNEINESGYIGLITKAGNIVYYDDLQIKEINPATEPGCSTNCNFQISLKQGINLISIPLIPNNNSIESLFQPILNDVRSIYAYDTLNSSWLIYHNNSSVPRTLSTINPRTGYFVIMKNPATLTINGNLTYLNETYPLLNVYQGWNIIGIHNLTGKNVGQELSGIDYSSAWLLNQTDGYEQLSNFYLTKPGVGYWVYVN